MPLHIRHAAHHSFSIIVILSRHSLLGVWYFLQALSIFCCINYDADRRQWKWHFTVAPRQPIPLLGVATERDIFWYFTIAEAFRDSKITLLMPPRRQRTSYIFQAYQKRYAMPYDRQPASRISQTLPKPVASWMGDNRYDIVTSTIIIVKIIILMSATPLAVWRHSRRMLRPTTHLYYI